MGLCSSSYVDAQPEVPKWNIFLHSNEARNRYKDDGSMPKDCSMSLLELRLFLDDPILIRTLATYAKETEYTDLFLCWMDIQEFKYLNAENVFYKRKVGLKIYEKYVNRKSARCVMVSIDELGFADEILAVLKQPEEQSFFAYVAGSAVHVEPVSDTVFDCVQLSCFLRIHEFVFTPFRQTDSYESISDRVINYNKVKEEDFKYYEKLGKGGFGVVVRGVKISTGVHYAIKIQTKKSLLDCFHDCPHRVDYEKQAMAKCKHPFIISLDYSFQTPTLAIMVMELGRAGTLKDSLERCENFMMDEDRVTFYAAEICLALLHLHSIGLMYRDLKPENILLSSPGHIKLVDLGGVVDPKEKLLKNPATHIFTSLFSSHAVEAPHHTQRDRPMPQSTRQPSVYNQSTMRARSVMGTRGFMAPEMLRMRDPQYYYQGYSKAVDWWSLGVTLFELLTGCHPFGASDLLAIVNRSTGSQRNDQDDSDPGEAVHHPAELLVILNRMETCDNEISPELIDLVKSFLTVDVHHRLGAGKKGEYDIKNHSVFEGLNWEMLEQMQIEPKFIPKCREINNKQEHESFDAMVKTFMKTDGHSGNIQNYYFKNWDYVSAHSQSLEMSQVLEAKTSLRRDSFKLFSATKSNSFNGTSLVRPFSGK